MKKYNTFFIFFNKIFYDQLNCKYLKSILNDMRLEYHVLQIPINYATYIKLKTRALESGIGIRQLLHSEIEQFKSNLVTLASTYEKMNVSQEPTSQDLESVM